MRKPKINPLIPLILRRSQIRIPLRLSHDLPPLGALVVAIHVVALDGDDEDEIPGQDSEEDFVAASIQRFVIVLVQLRTEGLALGWLVWAR
jgi:hypothetical protein